MHYSFQCGVKGGNCSEIKDCFIEYVNTVLYKKYVLFLCRSTFVRKGVNLLQCRFPCLSRKIDGNLSIPSKHLGYIAYA